MQANNEERKEWDTYALKLETVDRDSQTESEVVHWILKYPVSELNVFVQENLASGPLDCTHICCMPQYLSNLLFRMVSLYAV